MTKNSSEARAASEQAKLAGKEAADLRARCAQLENKSAAQLVELQTVGGGLARCLLLGCSMLAYVGVLVGMGGVGRDGQGEHCGRCSIAAYPQTKRFGR